jgi:fibronectin type 3 domain-containing protein
MRRAVLILLAGLALLGWSVADINAAQAKRGIELRWQDNSNNEAQFNVWRIASNSSWWYLIGRVGPNVTVYRDTTTRKGRFYCYTVTAANASGESAASNESCDYGP